MTGFVQIEKCRILKIGSSLYAKIPSILKDDGTKAGDTLVWMRQSQSGRRTRKEMLGVQVEKAAGSSNS